MPELHAVLDRATPGRRPWPVLLVLCLVLWLPGFFTLPPGDRDESRFAQASKQMLETGDYVQIRNGLVARNQKPIGIYWLQLPFAAAARATGVAARNPVWPYRMPSLLGGIIAVLACYGFGRRLVGPRAALLGAAFLAASVVLTTEVHIAKTDAALLATTTLAMGVLSQAYLERTTLRLPAALLFWAALGVGILIKGPITPMVVGLAIAWLAITGYRSGPPAWLWSLRPKWGLLLLLAIVAPWFVAIGIATHGHFFAQSVGGDLANKLAGSDDAHGAPAGFHLVLLPLLLFAGGIAAICAAPATWRSRKLLEIRFLIAWILPAWVVFEAVATKLPHYTLPLYPAIALLAGRWMLDPAPPHRRNWIGSACAIVVVALLGTVAMLLPEIVKPGLYAVDLLGLPAACLAALLVWWILRVLPDPRRTVLAMLCATPFLYTALFGLELPLLAPLWIAPRVAAALATHWPRGRPADAAFGELGFAEPSLMFLCGTGTQLLGDPAAALRFLAQPDRVLAVGDRDVPTFMQKAEVARLVPVRLGSVTGYNYSRGRRITLTLFGSGTQQPVKG